MDLCNGRLGCNSELPDKGEFLCEGKDLCRKTARIQVEASFLLTTHYSLFTTHCPFKNSPHPAPANTPVSPALSAYSPPAAVLAPHPPPQTSAAPQSCSAPRYKHASPGKHPRCHSSSKAARSESFLRSLSLTLTLEALAKRVNSSNLALCTPLITLFSPVHPHCSLFPRPRSPPYQQLPHPNSSQNRVVYTRTPR